MNDRTPPRSPHVQIYQPQLTSVLSFSHRISGVALSLGAVILVIWLFAATIDGPVFAALDTGLRSIPGQVLLFLWTFALFFHWCNGIRHLFWDAVIGFDLANIYRSGWLVLGASAVFTIAAWTTAWLLTGGAG